MCAVETTLLHSINPKVAEPDVFVFECRDKLPVLQQVLVPHQFLLECLLVGDVELNKRGFGPRLKEDCLGLESPAALFTTTPNVGGSVVVLLPVEPVEVEL